MRKSSSFFVISCLIIIFSNPFLFAQNESAPVDTLFYEIILNEKGVVAYDSSGNEWYYDFQSENFVLGTQAIFDDSRNIAPSLNKDEISVDERCTELVKVKTPATKTVKISYDEYVEGDIIATGRVYVKGWVKGDIKSYSGRVIISASGQVDGNITAPEIIVKEGAVVKGRQIIDDSPLNLDDIGFDLSVEGIIVILSLSTFFIFLGFIILALMPTKQQTINEAIDNYKIKSFLFGLMVILLLPVFLAITIIGIVLIVFLPFVYLITFAIGFNYFTEKIGQTLFNKFSIKFKNVYIMTLIGFVFMVSMWLVTTILLSMNQQPAFGFGIFFLVISIIISAYPICVGVGGAALTRYGFKKYTSWKEKTISETSAKVPAPPPIPKAPDNISNGFANNFKSKNRSSDNQSSPPPLETPPPPD